AAGHLLLVAADEGAQHVLLEAEGVADVPPLERWDPVLTVVTPAAAMKGGLIDPEAGLAPEVQVPDDLDRVLHLDAGVVLPAAAAAAAASGPGPGDLEAVAVAVPLVGGDGDPGGQIHVDGDRSHGRPCQAGEPR